MKQDCPICYFGTLIEHTHSITTDSGMLVGNLKHSVCSYCEEWITTPEQSRYNKQKIINETH
jgi:hypothetical protein